MKMMKTIVRPHNLKDIVLVFDESKPQPDFEKEALELYYEAHDVVYDLKLRLDKFAADATNAHDQVADLYMEALALEQSLDIVEDSLGLSDGANIPEIATDFSINVTDLFQELEVHNRTMQNLHTLIEDLSSQYDYEIGLMDPEDEYQENWPIHSRYYDMFYPVFPRYEELSVDIVSVDDDQQDFLRAAGEIIDAYQVNLDFAEEVFESYNNLYALVDPIYQRAGIAMGVMEQKMKDDLGLQD